MWPRTTTYQVAIIIILDEICFIHLCFYVYLKHYIINGIIIKDILRHFTLNTSSPVKLRRQLEPENNIPQVSANAAKEQIINVMKHTSD